MPRPRLHRRWVVIVLMVLEQVGWVGVWSGAVPVELDLPAPFTGAVVLDAQSGFTLAGLAEGGMTVGPAGDALMSGLKEVGATMTAEWLEAAGDTGKAIVDAYNAN